MESIVLSRLIKEESFVKSQLQKLFPLDPTSVRFFLGNTGTESAKMGKNLLLGGAVVFTAPFAKGWLITKFAIAGAQLEVDFLGKDNCTLDDKKEILAKKNEF